jgi:hypothetical protein
MKCKHPQYTEDTDEDGYNLKKKTIRVHPLNPCHAWAILCPKPIAYWREP